MIHNLQEDVLALPGDARGARRRRPFGLLAICILLTLEAAVGMIVLLFLAATVIVHPAFAVQIPVYNYLVLLEIIGAIAAATGLWAGRRWAWYLTMLVLAGTMTTDMWRFIHGQPEYISMLINVLMVFYLNQQEVRSLFMEPAQTAQALAARAPADWTLAPTPGRGTGSEEPGV
jgi:hypothetical protein